MFEDPFTNSDMFPQQNKKPAAPQAQAVTQQRIPSMNPGEPKEVNKYNILNMFWLMNPKMFNGKDLLENECHFVTISFNINFGNIRIEFGNMTQESMHNHLICLNKINRFANATIYPTAMFEIISGKEEVTCYEQIITFTGEDWQTKRPFCQIHKQPDDSLIMSIDKNVYQFMGEQKDMFLYSLKFALNQGMLLSGQNIIKSK